MKQSHLSNSGVSPRRPLGLHAAIIMDGSGRWAERRGLLRESGHREGARAVRRTVEAATSLDLGTLTLFAFSGDNWHRPEREVSSLMQIFEQYLTAERETCIRHGIRLNVIGRRDRLPPSLRQAAEEIESATAAGCNLNLRIAVDYSARDAILEAARLFHPLPGLSEDGECAEFDRLLAEAMHLPDPAPEVDLLIRTGGEQRLSDCLLWEIAHAELVFLDRLWPDFTAADLAYAVEEFHRRDRRFGRIREVVAS